MVGGSAEAFDRADLAAADRRVEHPAAGVGEPGGQSARGHRRNAAHVDDQPALRQAADDAVRSGQHHLHVGRVRQHRDDHIRLARHLHRGLCGHGPGGHERSHRATAAAVHHQRVAVGE